MFFRQCWPYNVIMEGRQFVVIGTALMALPFWLTVLSSFCPYRNISQVKVLDNGKGYHLFMFINTNTVLTELLDILREREMSNCGISVLGLSIVQ
jgi:hypothetical protein